jgi:hypothetical protein
MDPQRRDDWLAAGALAALLALLARDGALDELRRPSATALGVGAAALVEWLFLRYPDRLLTLWDRPGVASAGGLGLVGAALAARRHAGLVAAGAWGLVTYGGFRVWFARPRDDTGTT